MLLGWAAVAGFLLQMCSCTKGILWHLKDGNKGVLWVEWESAGEVWGQVNQQYAYVLDPIPIFTGCPTPFLLLHIRQPDGHQGALHRCKFKNASGRLPDCWAFLLTKIKLPMRYSKKPKVDSGDPDHFWGISSSKSTFKIGFSYAK